jgi:copper(I)-binding protein
VFWSSRASGLPRRLLIVAAVALVPAVAGCEAGNNAPTLQWHYPTEGAGTAVPGTHISIRNVFVLGSKESTVLPAGRSASLFFALVNTGNPDRLLSIQAPGTATAVTIPGGSIPLTAARAVLLTGPRPRAVLTGLTRPVATGTVITLVLNFKKAGTVRLRVPVLAGSPQFATFSPPPVPTPTPTAKRRHHHHPVSPSPSTTGAAATVTPSPTASSTP